MVYPAYIPGLSHIGWPHNKKILISNLFFMTCGPKLIVPPFNLEFIYGVPGIYVGSLTH